MKLASVDWAFAALMLVIGCVPSLNPVFRDDQLIFDTSLLGVWSQPTSSEKWEVTQRDESSYRIIYTDQDGQRNPFIGYLAEIEGIRFLELSPDTMGSDESGFYQFHMVPIHTVYLVRQTAPSLELSAIDFRWLDQYLTEHPDAIQCATFHGRQMITAPTDDVQAFVRQHQEMFTSEFQMERLL